MSASAASRLTSTEGADEFPSSDPAHPPEPGSNEPSMPTPANPVSTALNMSPLTTEKIRSRLQRGRPGILETRLGSEIHRQRLIKDLFGSVLSDRLGNIDIRFVVDPTVDVHALVVVAHGAEIVGVAGVVELRGVFHVADGAAAEILTDQPVVSIDHPL